MKGCISYEIVRLMGEGMHPQEACETAVNRLDEELKSRRGQAGDLSLIAMNNKGEWGAAPIFRNLPLLWQRKNRNQPFIK